MIIGILSDAHGRAEITGRAVECLLSRGAELLLYLGDFETEAVIDELVGHPARIVFGNCDDARRLADYAALVGVTVDHPIGTVEVNGRRVAFTHGDRPALMRAALDDGVDYLLHGHSHEVRDERVGRTRIVSPGALFRASRYTVACLDPTRDQLEIVEIDRTLRGTT